MQLSVPFCRDYGDVFKRRAFGLRVLVTYPAKRFVYIIRSVSNPEKRHIGVTSDIEARIKAHNAGMNRSTARWTPWSVDVLVEFRTERMAMRFEKYLKSGAGLAFATRHFVE